ncbi:hypothetical protein B0J13DRAFT_612826 [Dactylonectria estremocensis]|uniref:Uncharacterized protein n=1 Tax=Dactylonectria estremocensis TaxID=1079267 RepID=A0A9P9DJG9_9HYPO|nr:hypothetical protein B0J13DRAFT_612826 [Dactylonectria estremocensis]
MILPRTETAELEKLKKFMNMNHEILRSRIVELTSEFRVVLPERKDTDDVVTIQTLMEGNSVGESWQMAIQGSSSLMMKICRRLRNEDESARNAIICHARGKEMGFLWTCEQCYERNILPGGCRQFQDNFDGACSACILQGHQRLCSARTPIVKEENYYQPSEVLMARTSTAQPTRKERGNLEGQQPQLNSPGQKVLHWGSQYQLIRGSSWRDLALDRQ